MLFEFVYFSIITITYINASYMKRLPNEVVYLE